MYFILAAAAGGIALAVRMTTYAVLEWSLAPLGAAVLCWGLSFFHGCRHLQSVQVLTRANADMLRTARGEDPQVGTHPERRAIAVEVLREIMERENTSVSKNYFLQFWYLIAGAVLFVGWHITQIVLRSTA